MTLVLPDTCPCLNCLAGPAVTQWVGAEQAGDGAPGHRITSAVLLGDRNED